MGSDNSVHGVYKLLKFIRVTKKLTQRAVADRLGVGQPAVSTFENAGSGSLDRLVSYAEALGVGLAVVVSVDNMEIRCDLTPGR